MVDREHAQGAFNEILRRIKTHEVVHIKVWDSNVQIIFAEDASIIGRQFQENEDFQQAMKGTCNLTAIRQVGKKSGLIIEEIFTEEELDKMEKKGILWTKVGYEYHRFSKYLRK